MGLMSPMALCDAVSFVVPHRSRGSGLHRGNPRLLSPWARANSGEEHPAAWRSRKRRPTSAWRPHLGGTEDAITAEE